MKTGANATFPTFRANPSPQGHAPEAEQPGSGHQASRSWPPAFPLLGGPATPSRALADLTAAGATTLGEAWLELQGLKQPKQQ
jgi:hypothetical protein